MSFQVFLKLKVTMLSLGGRKKLLIKIVVVLTLVNEQRKVPQKAKIKFDLLTQNGLLHNTFT